MAGPEKIVAALQQLTDDEEVEKMTMGIQQLEDALLRYYEERYHSAIVLAGAAEQLFAATCISMARSPRLIQVGRHRRASRT
jgi:aspartate/methionine/tyrosine aminotransferase